MTLDLISDWAINIGLFAVTLLMAGGILWLLQVAKDDQSWLGRKPKS